MSAFADRLTYERETVYGYTQEELSEMLDISRDTLSKWENGHRLPDIEQLQKICKIFNCDTDYMLGNISERSHDIRRMMNKTGLSEITIQLLEDWNVAAFPQVSRIVDFIVQYRLYCIKSNIRDEDLIDRLDRFFTNQPKELLYNHRTGNLIPDDNGIEWITPQNLFFDTISTDDAAIVGINNILRNMKKEWNNIRGE